MNPLDPVFTAPALALADAGMVRYRAVVKSKANDFEVSYVNSTRCVDPDASSPGGSYVTTRSAPCDVTVGVTVAPSNFIWTVDDAKLRIVIETAASGLAPWEAGAVAET